MINPDYLELLKQEGLSKTPSQKARGLFFGFLITYREEHPELKDYLLDDEEHRAIFPYEDYQIYQIKLCKTNPDTLQLELKVPMFGGSTDGEYENFLNLLVNYHVTGKGHQNNLLEYSIFDKDGREDKKAFEQAKLNVKGFDIVKAAIVTSNYYETTKYATKLATYLSGQTFALDYKNYV